MSRSGPIDGCARCLFAAAAWAALAACGVPRTGTETDNPNLGDFEGSQCKKNGGSQAGRGATRAALSASADYDGLHCLTWQARGDGTLELEVLNHPGECLVEVDWQPRVAVTEGAVDLLVSGEPECRIAACGTCAYDYAFELTDLDLSAPLAISFAQQICEQPVDEPSFEIELPLDEAPQGIACRQLPAGTLAWFGACGGLHLPCFGARSRCFGEPREEPSCDDGLVCDGSDAAGLCLAPCEVDSDCPLPDIEVCDDGLCRVPNRL